MTLLAELRELALHPNPTAGLIESLQLLPPTATDADVIAVMRRYLTEMSGRHMSEFGEISRVEHRLLGIEDRIAQKEDAGK